jgi:putative PIN family toxin of toxin-antitoxin system
VVSANLVDEGPSAAVLNLAMNRMISMFVSTPILAEYEEVLRRPRFKLPARKVSAVLALIRSTSTLVKPSVALQISRDESDNRFYECAHAARADYLITGNTVDFNADYKRTKVVNPRQFLDLIRPHLTER